MPKKNKKTNGEAEAPAVDPYAFTDEDMRYDLNEFLCAGSDDRGQSVRINLRIPPLAERNLECLRDSKKFPYKTISDIVRHALIRHMKWLARLEDDIPKHYMSGLDAVMEVMRDGEIRAQIEQTFQKMDAMTDTALAAGDAVEARRLLTLAKSKVSNLPDSRWKRKWLDRFSQKYAHHLMGGSAISEVEQ